mmetsp:Transcript_64370/g.127164  ORF Transcript_64370/g.127164 Transcript_64370/m.127164 type:complete len:89 (+) Transcript_64370:203-469(+)
MVPWGHGHTCELSINHFGSAKGRVDADNTEIYKGREHGGSSLATSSMHKCELSRWRCGSINHSIDHICLRASEAVHVAWHSLSRMHVS